MLVPIFLMLITQILNKLRQQFELFLLVIHISIA